MQDLKSCLVLQTNKGMVSPASATIYLTRCYGNPLDLKGLLSCEYFVLKKWFGIELSAQYNTKDVVSPF